MSVTLKNGQHSPIIDGIFLQKKRFVQFIFNNFAAEQFYTVAVQMTSDEKNNFTLFRPFLKKAHIKFSSKTWEYP